MVARGSARGFTPPGGGVAPAPDLEPIELVLWVGPCAAPPSSPNGTAVTDGTAGPFLNLQDAFDFVQALPVGSNTKVTYYVTSNPGVYTTPDQGAHKIIGLDTRTQIGALTITPLEEGSLLVECVNLSGTIFVAGGLGNVILNVSNDSTQNGGLGAPDIAIGDAFGGSIDLTGVNLFVQSCVTSQSRARFYNCEFPSQGAILCASFDDVVGCAIDANNTMVCSAVPSGVGFVATDFFDGPVEFSGPPGCIVMDPTTGLTFNTATTLTAGATTNLAADAGKVLTVVAPGVPRYMPAGAAAATYGLYAARPAPGNAGARWVSSDGATEWVDDGTAWRPMIAGRPGMQIPALASFPNVYSGGVATFADAQGRITASSVGGVGQALCAQTQAIPPGPWSKTLHCTLAMEGDGSGGDNAGAMLVLTADGIAFRTLGLQLGFGQLSAAILDWTTIATPPALFGSATFGPQSGGWFRVRDDTVNTVYEASPDGLVWTLLRSEASIGFNEAGVGVEDNVALAAVFDSWE